MDFKGFNNIEIRPNVCPKQFCSNVAQNTSLKLRWMWWERCGNMNLLGDKEEQKLSSVAPSESLKAKTISDLWTSNPVQFSVVECKDGGAAADVALLLLMWRPPNCWALPYGSYCQPRGSGQSWLMLGDTTNVDSLLMWILPIILMWTPLIPFKWIPVIR